jgi:hypothetical protein
MEPLLVGKLSTVDLLVLTSLDQVIFIFKILFTYVTKQTTLLRRSIVQSPLPLQLVFPGLVFLQPYWLQSNLQFCNFSQNKICKIYQRTMLPPGINFINVFMQLAVHRNFSKKPCEKMLMELTPGACVIKLITAVIYLDSMVKP